MSQLRPEWSVTVLMIVMAFLFLMPAACVAAGTVDPPVLPGIDVLLRDELHLIAGKRVGLVTHAAGVNAQLRSSADLLHEHPEVELRALFAPEHGIRGAEPHGAQIGNHFDSVTGIPVYSLYGSSRKPTPQSLRNLDVLLVDLQGVGSYWYTYKFTMSYVLEAAIENDLPLIILDRPNPLGGALVEGPVMSPYGLWRHPIALRHGMTHGELALMWNEEYFAGKADLTVVRMAGWTRDMLWSDTGLQWVLPSPNIPTAETALLYAGTGLFENTNLSVGRGTTLPFQWFGGPGIRGEDVANELNSRGIPGVLFRPAYFKPLADKLAGIEVGGVQIHVLDPHNYQSVATAFHVADAFRRIAGSRFAWNSGGPSRLQVMAGVPIDTILASYEPELSEWMSMRAKYLLYD